MDDNTKALVAAQLVSGMLAAGQHKLTLQTTRDADFAVALYTATMAALTRTLPKQLTPL